MKMMSRALIACSIVISTAAVAACGGESAKDGSMTSTDAVSVVGTPGPPMMDRPTANEADMSARKDAMAPEQAPGQDPFQSMGQFNTGATSMMIRTGQAFIEVEQLDPAVLKVRQLAAQVGGFIANSSITGGKDQIRQATFELKIPAGKYDETVGSLSRIGKVETVSSSAQDVGEEFVDITARVTNAKRLEERLISLLANRTGKLDDVLRVERELARVREEIERYEGRLRYLSSRVAMSTLTITVHEPGPILGNNPGENP
ncbi:MAG: DUF4349 domain-containing protein, partial [Gemmatimonadaceae bacterium]